MNTRITLAISAMLLGGVVGCSNSMQEMHPSPLGGPSGADALKNVPLNANTHFAAGQLAESQGNIPRAVEQYKEALKLDPKNADSLFRLGVIYTQAKEFDLATAAWQRYVNATDGSATAFSNLAFCYEVAGRPELAETNYQRGIIKDPSDESCRVNYGYMLARHGRPNEALLQFTAVLTPAQAHYDLGTVYETQNRKEAAKAEYKKAAELDPDMTDAAEKLAMLSKD